MSADRTFTPEVERWLAGELSESDSAALRAKLGDTELARIRAQHEREHEALMHKRAPEDFARLIGARHSRERARRAVAAGFLASGLAVAAALIVWRAPTQPQDLRLSTDSVPSERLKGLTPELSIFRKTADGIETLSPNAEVRAEDVLQVGYSAAGRSYGAVLSIDGSGTVTLHSPLAPSEEAVLTPQGKHMLHRSYELDAAPEFERFFLVTSSAPIDVAHVIAAAERLAKDHGRAKQDRLDLPGSFTQISFFLRKAPP